MAMITSSNVSPGLYVICQGNPQNIEQQSWMESEERVGENGGFMPPMMKFLELIVHSKRGILKAPNTIFSLKASGELVQDWSSCT